ncbi:hypothetical protein HYH03_009504 [Edaphochlamys debaryana]|uniref:tRNA(Phe) 7-[(3-amino-3-carboxypropyl)-4-demethylwyosine(37)-N(4)]-methyltransferase n=1 Tax=Edaphochlamys debaryana TaxID=47281 RepID=A0A836BYI4_9CHLO|nr:hypothetical protein HYH03_009504 [Edaphochlamys debaryana]|eukprot:KAG2492264.1 hypothetical protein HYH03_009504 [Edaphochlamys debaryana]
MVLDAFEQRRAVVLAGLQAECGDKSRKGSVDAPIASLVARINAHPGVYTTSSCSGRISVFGEPTPESRAGGKKGGEWAYASHEPADKQASGCQGRERGEGEPEWLPAIVNVASASVASCHGGWGTSWFRLLAWTPHGVCGQEVIASVHRSSAGGARLVLRFEPFVLHLEARTPEMGQRVLAAARAAGFRESGLTLGSGGRRVMVGVRCSLRLEAPVADAGRVLVPDDYLSYLVDLANDKFQQNLDRIAKFEAELLAVLDAPAPSGFQLSQPPAPPPRQNASAVRHTPAAAAADGSGAGPSGRPAAAAAAGGLAAAPVRRRGAGGGGGLAMAPTAAVEALRKRQARVLGRLTALEQKLGGSKAGPSRAAGGGGGSGGSRTGGAAAKGAAAAAAAAEAAGAKRDKGVAAAADEGAGGLRWLPVPLSPELQVRTEACLRIRLAAGGS